MSTSHFLSSHLNIWPNPWWIFGTLVIFDEIYLYHLNVWFQKISIPPPTDGSSDPLGISVPEGSCITHHPPGISYFLFHGLKLPHLEIFDHVPLKINCSHRKTIFMIFDIFVIFYKAICISYAGRTSLRDYEQSLFCISPSSGTREARKQRVISLCHLKKTFIAWLLIWTIHWNKTMWKFSNFKTNLLKTNLQTKFISTSSASSPKVDFWYCN